MLGVVLWKMEHQHFERDMAAEHVKANLQTSQVFFIGINEPHKGAALPTCKLRGKYQEPRLGVLPPTPPNPSSNSMGCASSHGSRRPAGGLALNRRMRHFTATFKVGVGVVDRRSCRSCWSKSSSLLPVGSL
ncbi:hypothetical protein OPV22_002204 [Ensete ventricosum]|uniref:Uncharacterized protein n=1 Tax=Ensete ventricosum TaxID=4639 RepID=A0AAV8RX93_ENSVE|nr:hypothetical protein OPV22_002204 [Ensete ventricosum]